jgi:hypothetical protein
MEPWRAADSQKNGGINDQNGAAVADLQDIRHKIFISGTN